MANRYLSIRFLLLGLFLPSPFFKEWLLWLSEKDRSGLFDLTPGFTDKGKSTIYQGSRGGYGMARFDLLTREYGFMSMDNSSNRAIGDVLSLYYSSGSAFYPGAGSGMPRVYTDVDGRYRGLDGNIHQADGFTNYTAFSAWDTYRALHPLFNIINRQVNTDITRSMLEHCGQSVHKALPVWSHMANEDWCMIGYHTGQKN